MAGTFFLSPPKASTGAGVVEAVDDRIVCDVTGADGDADGAVVDKAVELGASEMAVISLLVPTTVLRGPLTAFTKY
jgi:hypothetical protein